MFLTHRKIVHKLTAPVVQERGFTLIELIVVTSIIIVFSAILLTRLPVLSATAQLNKGVNDLVQVGLNTYSDSVSVKQFRSGIYPSYGIFLDTAFPRRILVFADCVADDNGDGILNDLDLFTYRPSALDCDGETVTSGKKRLTVGCI